MWRLNPHHGAVLEPEEYVDSVRLRLGCAGSWEPVPCAACQSGSLDTGAAHATCCALGEATRGHNAVTDLCTLRLSPAIALQRLRFLAPTSDPPTSAPGNSCTTLGISVCSPHAQRAGSDCTQTRRQAKLAYHGPHIPAPLRQHISDTPIVRRACGRRHRDTLTVFRSLGKPIARKRNFVPAEVVYQKLNSSTTPEIWKRSARQIRACWPLAALPDSLDPDPWSLPWAPGPRPPVGFWSLMCWCLRFPLPILSLRRASASALSRFACPSHVTCVAHGSF